jgi:hypothetical protein
MSPQGVTLDAIARNKLSHGKPLKQKLAKGAKEHLQLQRITT